jgi:hypothetical protein
MARQVYIDNVNKDKEKLPSDRNIIQADISINDVPDGYRLKLSINHGFFENQDQLLQLDPINQLNTEDHSEYKFKFNFDKVMILGKDDNTPEEVTFEVTHINDKPYVAGQLQCQNPYDEHCLVENELVSIKRTNLSNKLNNDNQQFATGEFDLDRLLLNDAVIGDSIKLKLKFSINNDEKEKQLVATLVNSIQPWILDPEGKLIFAVKFASFTYGYGTIRATLDGEELEKEDYQFTYDFVINDGYVYIQDPIDYHSTHELRFTGNIENQITVGDVSLEGNYLNGRSLIVAEDCANNQLKEGSPLGDYFTVDTNEEKGCGFNGKEGDDIIEGGLKDDELIGGSGNDEIFGGLGDDFISGGKDDDIIEGGPADDRLIGGSGNDEIFGGLGDDFISGGKDDDTIIGGAGSDSFCYQKNDGNDVIKDYNHQEDRILLIGIDKQKVKIVKNLTVVTSNLNDLKNQWIFSVRYNDKTIVKLKNQTESVSTNDISNSITTLVSTSTVSSCDDAKAPKSGYLLEGTVNNDTLRGGVGDDIIIGGHGDDRIVGGDGEDRFCYKKDDGLDVIEDFNHEEDFISLFGVDMGEVTKDNVSIEFITSDPNNLKKQFSIKHNGETIIKLLSPLNLVIGTISDMKEKIYQRINFEISKCPNSIETASEQGNTNNNTEDDQDENQSNEPIETVNPPSADADNTDSNNESSNSSEDSEAEPDPPINTDNSINQDDETTESSTQGDESTGQSDGETTDDADAQDPSDEHAPEDPSEQTRSGDTDTSSDNASEGQSYENASEDENQSNEPTETVNPPSADADNTDSNNESSNSSEDSEAEPDTPVNKDDETTESSTQGDESKSDSTNPANDQSDEQTSEDHNEPTSDDDQIPNTDGDTGDVEQDDSNNIDTVEGSNHEDQIVSITGRAIEGKTLTASSNKHIDGYQWHADGIDIKDANKQNYILRLDDVGKEISVSVRFQNSQGQEETSKSNETSKIFTSILDDVSDFKSADIKEVEQYNIDAIKTAIIPGQMNREQVEKIVSSYNIIYEYAGDTNNDLVAPTIDNYIDIGIKDLKRLDQDQFNLFDSVITYDGEIADDVAKIQELVNTVIKLSAQPNKLEQTDFEILGILEVTNTNLVQVQQKIIDGIDKNKKIDSIDAINALINQVIDSNVNHDNRVEKLVIKKPDYNLDAVNIGDLIGSKIHDWQQSGHSMVLITPATYPSHILDKLHLSAYKPSDDNTSKPLSTNAHEYKKHLYIRISNKDSPKKYTTKLDDNSFFANNSHWKHINLVNMPTTGLHFSPVTCDRDLSIASFINNSGTLLWKDKNGITIDNENTLDFVIPKKLLKEINQDSQVDDSSTDSLRLVYQDCYHVNKNNDTKSQIKNYVQIAKDDNKNIFKEKLTIKIPYWKSQNGFPLDQIDIELHDIKNKVVNTDIGSVKVDLRTATDERLVCINGTNHCDNAKLTCLNESNTCKTVQVNNGNATFNNLVISGKAHKIYNLEFTYVDADAEDEEQISSLEYQADDNKKILKNNSTINHKSQVYIYKGGEATELVFATKPSDTAKNNEALVSQPAIEFRDNYGNIATDHTATLEIGIDGDAILFCEDPCQIKDTKATVEVNNGIASFSGLKIKGKIGVYKLTFSAAGLNSIDNAITLNAGEVSKLVVIQHHITGADLDIASGDKIPALEVEAQDINENTIKNSDAVVQISIDNDATLSCENPCEIKDNKATVRLIDGKASFDNVRIRGKVDKAYSLTITEESGISTTSFINSFNIIDEQIPHSFEVENLNCHKFDNKDSNICFISTDKKQETISFSLRDQDNDLINNNKDYSIKANGDSIDPIKDKDGNYKYTWNINESFTKELKLYHVYDNQTVELNIVALDEPKWIEPTNCFDYEDIYNYIFLDVGQILRNHSNSQDLDVTINFNVDTGLLRQQNNLFNNNKITIKCVLGDMPIETNENANEIIWQISKEEYEKKWPNRAQITASVNIQELEFKVNTLVPITKTIFLDWPIERLISFPLDKDQKITVGDAENGEATIDDNILYYDPDSEKAHQAMLGTFEYDLQDDELFDRLPISITSVDGSQINAYLHIKFAPDKSYKYQYYFQELDSSGVTHNTGINLHKAIISGDTKNTHKGYSGDGVTVAIAGDGIFHHQELDEIIKSDLIESFSQIDGIAEQNEMFPNNTNIAGIIASQVNDPSYGMVNIRGISPNVDLVNIAVVDTSYNNTQKATRTAVMKLLSDRASYYYEKPTYQKISNATNEYSLHESLKTSDINILNLNFTLSKPFFTQTIDTSIERYLWDATSRNHQLNTDYNKELYKTKFGNTIFINGLDGYTEEESALFSNHPAIINVASYFFENPDTTEFKSTANWVSVPIEKNMVLSICYVTDDILCENLDTSNEFPERHQSGYAQFYEGNSIASAIVTGVIALMLEANSNLTWRDIKYILANTAKVSDIKNMTKNTAGYKFDAKNNYGFGFIDAEAALKMASSYKKDLGDLRIIEKRYIKSWDWDVYEDRYDMVSFNVLDNINIEAITLTYEVVYKDKPNLLENLSIKVMNDDHGEEITIPSYPNQQELKITFNHFYGESSEGEWHFSFKHRNDNDSVDFIRMKMTIYGTQTDIRKTAE